MAEIHNIEENMPHKVSEVICINCKHRWLAARPCITQLKDLECPNCHEQGYVIETGEIMDADFETWWNLYQKKRGREKCMKKWAKLSAKDRQACIQATPAYVQSTPDVTYRKDPYTYLNNKSWNDTIYFRNNPDLQRQQRIAASAELVARYAAESNSAQSEAPATD
jgi:hypothetical protein